jgi:hypothetical protein
MKLLTYYDSVVNIFPFTAYKTPESEEYIFHWPGRKLSNVPINYNNEVSYLFSECYKYISQYKLLPWLPV